MIDILPSENKTEHFLFKQKCLPKHRTMHTEPASDLTVSF